MVHRMGDAKGVIGPVAFVGSWQELAELGDRHPGSPALVDPALEDPDNPASQPSTWASVYSWSSTPLIYYGKTWRTTSLVSQGGHPYTAFLRAGVDDDVATLDATVLRCIDVRRVRRLLERLQRCVHPFTHRMFYHTLNLAIRPVPVPVVADTLGFEERTLQRHSTAHGIPRPNAIISLARIFTVERLAEWSGRTSGTVALSLGFSAKSNYRRLTRRHLGIAPTTIQERGGAKYLEDMIVGMLTPKPDPRPTAAHPPLDPSALSSPTAPQTTASSPS